MQKYRVVFCDIDGTLLDSQHRLAAGTVAKIRDLSRTGTPFVLVSARMPDAMYAIQDELRVSAPMVSYGGALVLDSERRPVHSAGIRQESALRLKREIAECGPAVASCIYSFGQWIVDDLLDARIRREMEIVGVEAVKGPAEAVLIPDNEVHKVFCVGDAGDITALEEELKRRHTELSIFKSGPHYLEIMNPAVSKAGAVEFVCRAMRIPVEESVAFGDNYNDADMLACAGLGVAMKNAPEEVRCRADCVTLTNDEEGVREMLEHLNFQRMDHSVRYERARL